MSFVTMENWDGLTQSESDMDTKHYYYKKVITLAGVDIFIGKEIQTGFRCLMFLAKKEDVTDKEKPFEDTNALEVRFDFPRNDDEKVGLLIKLTKDSYKEVFIVMVNNILEAIKDKEDEAGFIVGFFLQLEVWKEFLKKAGPKGMSPEAVRGLYGELWFIKTVFHPLMGDDSIRLWTGPEAGIHDFEMGQAAIEVKTTAGNKSHSVFISNERQLDESGYERLFLYHAALTLRKNSADTLPALINEVRALLKDSSAKLRFDNLLLNSGYSESQKNLYKSQGFHVGSVGSYNVAEGFPRLIASDLPEGVGGLKYKLDLSACASFKIESDDFSAELDRLK